MLALMSLFEVWSVLWEHHGVWRCTLMLIGMVLVLAAFWLTVFRPRMAVRVRQFFEKTGTIVLIGLGMLIFLFSAVGFGLRARDDMSAVAGIAYNVAQMFSLNIDSEKLGEPDGADPGGGTLPLPQDSEFAKGAKVVDAERARRDQAAQTMTTWTMLFSALFILGIGFSAIKALFRHAFVNALMMVTRRHVVICGLGRIGREIFSDLIETDQKRRIVVIEPDAENDHVEWVRRLGGLVVIGDATRPEVLVAAKVRSASEIFLVMGRDETNIEAAIEMRDLFRKAVRDKRSRQRWLRKSRVVRRLFWLTRPVRRLWERLCFWRRPSELKCHLHILNRDLASIVRIQSKDIEDECRTLRMEVFNALERTARRLIEEMVRLEVGHGDGCRMLRPTSRNEVSHFVILGFDEFGQTLALQLAEQAHFENLKRLRMTILDQDIRTKAKRFQARYPRFAPETAGLDPWEFDPAADNWESKLLRPAPLACSDDPDAVEYVANARFEEMYDEITDDEFIAKLRFAFERPPDAPPDVPQVLPAILVCFAEDGKNFALAERLREKLRVEGLLDWPIFVWIPEQQELSKLLINQAELPEWSRPKSAEEMKGPLIPFGQCSRSTSYQEITHSWSDWLARHILLVWDQAYSPQPDPEWKKLLVSFQQAEQGVPPQLPDFQKVDELSLDRWADEKREAMRASNRSAAINTVVKLAVLGREIVDEGRATTPVTTPIEVSPEEYQILWQIEHNRWLAERLLGGWRYGAGEKNVARQTHPMVVAWKDVPDRFRANDARLVSTVVGLCRVGAIKTREIQRRPRPAPSE